MGNKKALVTIGHKILVLTTRRDVEKGEGNRLARGGGRWGISRKPNTHIMSLSNSGGLLGNFQSKPIAGRFSMTANVARSLYSGKPTRR